MEISVLMNIQLLMKSIFVMKIIIIKLVLKFSRLSKFKFVDRDYNMHENHMFQEIPRCNENLTFSEVYTHRGKHIFVTQKTL